MVGEVDDRWFVSRRFIFDPELVRLACESAFPECLENVTIVLTVPATVL